MADTDTVDVRYLVDDVAASVDFYTRHFDFTVGISSPAFADVTRGNLRLLLSGPQSSAGRAMADGNDRSPAGGTASTSSSTTSTARSPDSAGTGSASATRS